MPSKSLATLCLGGYFLSLPAGAEDSFSTVMARMKPQAATSIHYQEVRYLALLDKPWHGSGYLYALPPNTLIKEQWKPGREIMGASGTHLYYFDPAKNTRHSGEMRAGDPAGAHVAAFSAVMNGDRELLNKLYRVEFCSQPEQWLLTLTSKNPKIKTSLAKIVISGLPEQAANKIEIYQTDGDHSELTLRPEPANASLQPKVDLLYKELQGAN